MEPTADVELRGLMLFFFRASSSRLEAVVLLGGASRLMTGVTEPHTTGRGAARRLFRVGGAEMGFSGSTARGEREGGPSGAANY